ncbi:hypothetical protein AAVH_19542 [Aphelenchoides avenae]|nr:hypothetical protein AAVH_19542 [Aphelenchus avenae]
MRLTQVLLCVIVVLWINAYFAVGSCKCPDSGKQHGFFTDSPCNECPTGRIRSCSRGSSVAFYDTVCIYASKKMYTHAAARMMCSDSDGGGFLAFATNLTESQHISGYVRKDLKLSEGNETYYWLGGKHKYIERTNQTFWLFEYRGYYENVNDSLLPEDIDKAIAEGRACLSGHTKNHTTLHARPCSEQLPAVCYNYRNVAKHFCRQDFDKDWTLFQGKCYYAYSAPTSKVNETYKTYFDAQTECKEMGAILATVTDAATFKKTLDLATGLETIMKPNDASWIGLQLSAKGHGGIYYNITDGTSRNFTKGQVEGWWEDGTPYDSKVLKPFWASGQPDEKELIDSTRPELIQWRCSIWRKYELLPANYNQERCNEDRFQHCAQIFPSGSIANCPKYHPKPQAEDWHADNPGKLIDNWCYFLQRGYICQRDAKPNPIYYAVEGRCVPSDPSSALLRL